MNKQIIVVADAMEASLTNSVATWLASKEEIAPVADRRKAVFSALDETKEELIMLELENCLLESNQQELVAGKNRQLSALKDINERLNQEKNEGAKKAMRGAKGRTLAELDQIKKELDVLYKERGEVLGKVKEVRALRSELKKQLNGASPALSQEVDRMLAAA